MGDLLKIKTLGGLDIQRGGEPVGGLASRKAEALLVYLAVTGRRHPREVLADFLWDDLPQSNALTNLRVVLSSLRKHVGAFVRITRESAGLDPEAEVWVDVAALERELAPFRAREGQMDPEVAEGIGRAVELYRGAFLEGFFVRDARGFEDWALRERERLHRIVLDALDDLVNYEIQTGAYKSGLAHASRALALDPLMESAHRGMMRLLALSGQREAALAQYETCKALLAEELGVDPMQETSTLAESIREGKIRYRRSMFADASRDLGGPVPSLSPEWRFPTSLVGRTTEVTRLRQVWQGVFEKGGKIILVEGEAGAGKTRLIEEFLSEIADQSTILRARCPEMVNPLAYTLFTDPLRQMFVSENIPMLSDAWLVELSRLLPELRDQFPHLKPPISKDPEIERRLLFDAISTVLLSLTKERSLTLFLDNLQWADSASLEVLNHFRGWMEEAPVLIIAAYRSHDFEQDHQLSKIRRDWQRADILTNIKLAPLSETAVADLLIELTTWTGVDPSFGRLIHQETAGNPLFIVEMINSLKEEDHLPENDQGWQRDFQLERIAIPSKLQTLIEARIGRLDELSHQVITAAAVMHGNLQADMIQAVSGRSELETLEGLENLLNRGLLVEREMDQFVFSHDKIREVVYGNMSQIRRKLMHRRAAEMMEKQHRERAKEVAGQLSHHYEQAGIKEKALVYHILAGHISREQYAYEIAAEHYQKATALLKAQEDYEQAAHLSMQAGMAHHQSYDFKGADRAFQEGFDLKGQARRIESDSPLPPAPHPLRLNYSEPHSLDPTQSIDWDRIIILTNLFSGLIAENPEMEIVPDIAQSWEIVDDGRTYIFNMREDARWSDGRPVTADDFTYAWQRVLSPEFDLTEANFLYDIKGARAYHQREVSTPAKVGITALDRYTLMVELEQPVGYFLNLLANPVTFPIPKHAVETLGETWAYWENIVSNGPFKIDSWERGKTMQFSRNPYYHGRFSGNVEEIELFLGIDSESELIGYQEGRLDVAQWQTLQTIRQHPSEERRSSPLLHTNYLVFDTGVPPFDDPRVRRALAMAIDRGQWRHRTLAHFGVPAQGGFIPPGLPGHSANIGLPFNPSKAIQLFNEAGYPKGNSFPVVDLLVGETHAQLADDIRAQWAHHFGIRVTRRTSSWGKFRERILNDRPSLVLGGWVADVSDPDNFLRVCIQSHHLSEWHRQSEYQALVEKARRTMDQRQRMDLYKKADHILIEEAVFIPLIYGRLHILVKPWIKGFAYSPHRTIFWQDIVIEPH